MSAEAALSENATFIWVQNYPEPNDYPLVNANIFLIALDIFYLLAVLKILPAFMKNREPFKLKTIIVLYNVFEVIASSWFVYLGIEIYVHAGFFSTTPIEEDDEIRKKMVFLLYVYFASKITEFMDTIFFVLRKKYNQVTFLHVYHHAATMFGTWLLCKYAATQSTVFGATFNSLVHVVMYFYYAVSALGPQYAKYLTWKKYITLFQLLQFVVVFLYQCLSLIFQRGPHPIYGIFYVLYSTSIFLVLFSQFYIKSYKKTKKVISETTNDDLQRNGEKVKAQ